MPTSATVAARPSKPVRPARGRDRSASASTPSIADLWARVAWLVTAVAWLFLGASLLSFDPADAPTHVVWPANAQPVNWCGATGAAVSYHVLRFVGWPIWLFMLGVGVVLVLPILGRRVEHLAVRLVGLTLIVASAATGLAILAPGAGPMPDLAGGMLGTVVSTELLARFGLVGAVLWSLLGLAIGAIVAMDRWLVTIPRYLMERSRPTAARVGRKAAE
ncbi:MAG: DNA translocase FtsK 4TM domain-containing protein, partial [Phycisphaerales bacterium]|nr:DNA translocase FtsK 4TM domain-containing protein [Phycisphaerales bacterium]